MDYFPAFMHIAGRRAIVVGGGTVAARKVAMLVRAGARVGIVARTLCTDLSDAVSAGAIDHRAGAFVPEQLDGAVLAIVATDDAAVNARVARHARLRGLPVNVVDDPAASTFITPAVIDRSPVVVAVSTAGASPVLARWVRTRIETALPATLGRLAKLAGSYRGIVKRAIPDIRRRRRFWESLIDGPTATLALARRDDEAEAALLDVLHGSDRGNEGEVHLVGAGPGDPDLLTIKALRVLQAADVIVHDRLVSPEILDLARRDAARIDVGKRPGAHAATQGEINDMLVRLARDGKRVARLKGGDPFVFGRGGEEMLALAAAGIICHVVPGITAATGCAAVAGIPLTHRDHAQSCVIVAGHGRDGLPDYDWTALARPRQTLAIYMGLGNLAAIADRLIGAGLATATPAAVIVNGTTDDERRVFGTLADIAARAAAAVIDGPALVIVGEVVALALDATGEATVLNIGETAA